MIVCARVVGSAVWRLRQRRANDHRSVRGGFGRQVEADVAVGDVVAARLRRTRTGAFKCAARTLFATVRGEQSGSLLSDDAGAVFSLVATAGARGHGTTLSRDDAEEFAAFACGWFAYRGSRERRVSTRD